ncbi:outer membrane autotransporter barrel domain protein [Chthoniobacter flavus Ellin428]|uniref:Outer membrane autotransporter barrel domain protein n=1 Tax=Chthoniobacter flavus Ellin428 TaxID=497964 RepID=B4D971_9BACT|nr:autotransporter outer membrane beta-barrel domain-containing protein [Chthoniobacter flavus]EDY16974.1 outer membrane autotransporter barrel domain protein [Chthoniobacter flavus Ellin428]TCO86061.1 outer membrane autotransporter protein [Chthoniobacter flavus]
MRASLPLVLVASAFALIPRPVSALSSDRTWLAAPISNNWNDGNNWQPNTPPDSPFAGAVFGQSNILNPAFTAFSFVGSNTKGTSIYFQPNASAYTIEINGQTVTLFAGIRNDSQFTQVISNGVANGSLTFSGGSIVGNVTIVNGGAGTRTTFTNAFNGGTVRLINASTTSTLDFSGVFSPGTTVGSIEGFGTIILGSNELRIGTNNLNTVFAGSITDGSGTGGSLVKVGFGSLTLSGVNTYTGNTTVLGGALFVNGSIASPQTFVEPGALLGGSGLIGGNVFSHGVVSPGNSPGKLTLAGNYTQYSDGTLRIEIGGNQAGQFDQLAVGGRASLDGTLEILSNGRGKLKRGDRLSIVTATAGVSGTFRDIENRFDNGTILTVGIAYEPNAVIAMIKQGSFAKFAESTGLSSNQISVARALDSAANTSRANRLFDYLDSRNRRNLSGDFDRIAPEELTSAFAIGMALANVQSANIQRRTDDIRSGSGGFSAAGLAINGMGPSYSGGFDAGVAGPNGDDGKDVKETRQVVPAENRWGAFLSGTGEWVSVGNTDNARGYHLDSGGFTLGVDYKVTPNFAIGLAAGYTGTTADLSDRGRLWVNGGKLGLYATLFQNVEPAAAPKMSKDSSKDSKEVRPPATGLGRSFYADVAVFGGYNSYDSRRSALQGDARGDTDGGELNVLFGTGYDFKKGHFTFGPTASFNYTYLGTSAFTEHGSLAPLDIHGGKGESLRTAFGLKASYDWKVGGVLIKPEIRAAWQHEYGDSAYDLTSSFANSAGESFLVAGPQLGRDSALLGAGVAIQCSERCSTFFYYDGELGRRNFQATNVTGGFRLAF